MKIQSGNKSEKIILKTAKGLFWKHGIRRVTVEEICKAAGVSKMTYYRNFKNKNEVAEKVLDIYFTDYMNNYRALMQSEKPFNEKIALLLDNERKASIGLSKEFIHDIYGSDDDNLRNFMEQYHKQSATEFYNDLKKAQKDGWIRPNIKIEFFVYMIGLIQREMSDDKFLNLFDDIEDASNEINDLLFYGLISHSKLKE